MLCIPNFNVNLSSCFVCLNHKTLEEYSSIRQYSLKPSHDLYSGFMYFSLFRGSIPPVLIPFSLLCVLYTTGTLIPSSLIRGLYATSIIIPSFLLRRLYVTDILIPSSFFLRLEFQRQLYRLPIPSSSLIETPIHEVSFYISVSCLIAFRIHSFFDSV